MTRKRKPSMSPSAIKMRAHRARKAEQAAAAPADDAIAETGALLDQAAETIDLLLERRKQDEAEIKSLRAAVVRHQVLEAAVAPYRETIQKFGYTDGQAVEQLFKWQMALAGPQKVPAFIALMKSHGIDPADFATALGHAPPTNGNGNGHDETAALQAQVDLLMRDRVAHRKRHAGSSMRSGAPVPPAGLAPAPLRNESVRDSIKRALSDLRQ